MGHKVRRKIFTLRFAPGSELDGATVRVRSIPFGQFTAMMGLAGLAAIDPEDMDQNEIARLIDPENVAQMAGLLNGFASALIEWDLEEEDGTPIPATADGVNSLDTDVAMEVIMPWVQAIQGTSPPLSGGSRSGGSSALASVPMEPLSASRVS